MSPPGTTTARGPERPRVPWRRLAAGFLAAWFGAVACAFLFGFLFQLLATVWMFSTGTPGGSTGMFAFGGFYAVFSAAEGAVALPLIGVPVLSRTARRGRGGIGRWMLVGLVLSGLFLVAQTMVGALALGPGVVSLDLFGGPAILLAGPAAALSFRAVVFRGQREGACREARG